MKKSKMVSVSLYQEISELVKKSDHKILGVWAADCAQRALPYFEEKYTDDRPRKALEILHVWVKTGEFKMSTIRTASLGAHAAAREIESDDVARSAARACGQAVATAHVPTHSIAAAIYAATVIRDKTNSEEEVLRERDLQYEHLLRLIKLNEN